MEGGGGRGEGDGEGGGEGELTLWGGLEGVLWRMVGQGMKNLGMEKDFERKDRLWGRLARVIGPIVIDPIQFVESAK